jgi:hypothetical protein
MLPIVIINNLGGNEMPYPRVNDMFSHTYQNLNASYSDNDVLIRFEKRRIWASSFDSLLNIIFDGDISFSRNVMIRFYKDMYFAYSKVPESERNGYDWVKCMNTLYLEKYTKTKINFQI